MESLQNILFNDLQALVVILNSNGEVVFVNRAVESLLGFDQKELMGNNWWTNTKFDLMDSTNSKQRIINLIEERSLNKTTYLEHRLKTVQGMVKWVRWNVKPMENGQLAALGLDITEKKRFEEQLIQNQKELNKRNRDLNDSLNYAARLQGAILPNVSLLASYVSNPFAYYKPKEAVGGDFYFYTLKNNKLYMFLADCTGHGVPGAMMTMLGANIVQRVLQNSDVLCVSEILNEIDKQLTEVLNQNDYNIYDGMDAILIELDLNTGLLCSASAQQTLWIVSNTEIKEVKGSLFPIGLWEQSNKQFEQRCINLNKGDTIVLSSDGFYDQFGGDKNKKFKRRNFADLLILMKDFESDEKEAYLDYTLENWKQNVEQTDDITVVGFTYL